MLTVIALLSDREIFDEAHQEFLDALSERDRARFPLCCSPDDLLQAITSVADQATQGKQRRLNRLLSLAQKLNGRLQLFFDAVNVIIATSPVAAAVYGSFRIAIQVRRFIYPPALTQVGHCAANLTWDLQACCWPASFLRKNNCRRRTFCRVVPSIWGSSQAV